jgi:glucosamine-6-phosphate deaminase
MPEAMETCAARSPYFFVDRLGVEIHASRNAIGQAAGLAAADHLRSVLRRQGRARVIFACAPSQNEFLSTLTAQPGIAWPQVTAFHMDEYVGLAAKHPASFRRYLREHLTGRVPVGRVRELRGEASNLEAECRRYARLLHEAPIDLVCLGIGENGHLAFNDPPVAAFNDRADVKVVTLDAACREQQVNDGCFPAFAAVPRQALTLTIPSLLSGGRLFCMVPGPRKAAAVVAALRHPISTACPASILRTCSAATLYLDRDSAAGLLA